MQVGCFKKTNCQNDNIQRKCSLDLCRNKKMNFSVNELQVNSTDISRPREQALQWKGKSLKRNTCKSLECKSHLTQAINLKWP